MLKWLLTTLLAVLVLGAFTPWVQRLGLRRMPGDIEVQRADSGAPELVLHGTAAEVAAARGVRRWLITLSHSDTVAQAIVVAL